MTQENSSEHNVTVQAVKASESSKAPELPNTLEAAEYLAAQGSVEALLFLASEPLSLEALHAATGIPTGELECILHNLAQEYRHPRGIVLEYRGEGYRFYSNTAYADVVNDHLGKAASTKLSTAALETLAVVAYRQPVTRSQIAQIRGVSVDSVVRTLLMRGLIQAVREESGGATWYGTTSRFLELLGLASLEELPPLAPYLPPSAELDELEKEIP